MSENVYFQDVGSAFIHHYDELMKVDPKNTEPMYDTNTKLIVGKEVFEGRDKVLQKILNMGKFELLSTNSFVTQPYGKDGDILITAKLKNGIHEYLSTFVLRDADKQSHRFTIIFQIIYLIS